MGYVHGFKISPYKIVTIHKVKKISLHIDKILQTSVNQIIKVNIRMQKEYSIASVIL